MPPTSVVEYYTIRFYRIGSFYGNAKDGRGECVVVNCSSGAHLSDDDRYGQLTNDVA